DRVLELGATIASLTAGAEERDAAADDRVGHLNCDIGDVSPRVDKLAETATRLQNDTKTAVDSLTDRLQTGNHRLIRLETSLTDHASQLEDRLETVSQSNPDPARVEELQRRLTELERSREETDLPTYAHLHD